MPRFRVSFLYRILFPAIFFFAIIFFDRWSKNYVLSLPKDFQINLLPYVDFILVKNTGIAFGLFAEQKINFIILSVLSLVLLTVIFKYFLPVFPVWPYILISSGALGNIIDRIMYGYVVDFIKIHQFYVFNIADASITIGSIILIYYLVFKQNTHACIDY